MPRLLAVLTLALAPALATAEPLPSWVEPMRKVHAKFTGKRGTLGLFGDSITRSLAFWAPLPSNPRNLSAQAKADLELVNGHQHKDCWRVWRGPAYGNEGSMTIRWA